MKGEIWHTAGRNGRNRDGRWDAGWILRSACVSQYPSEIRLWEFPGGWPPREARLPVYRPPREIRSKFYSLPAKTGPRQPLYPSISSILGEKGAKELDPSLPPSPWNEYAVSLLTKSWRRRRWRFPRTWTARTRSSTSSISPENTGKRSLIKSRCSRGDMGRGNTHVFFHVLRPDRLVRSVGRVQIAEH